MDYESAHRSRRQLQGLQDAHGRLVRLEQRAASSLTRLETGARAAGETHLEQIARLGKVLDQLQDANRTLTSLVHAAADDGQEWAREFAIACTRELPHQHAPVGVHSRWKTPKKKSVGAEAVVSDVSAALSAHVTAAAATPPSSSSFSSRPAPPRR